MKKYRKILDVVLLVGLTIVSLLAVAPKTFVMPNSLQMVLLTAVTSLVAGFLILLWRENPSDERELLNQATASRFAYFVGAVVLIIALVVQSIDHKIDSAVPIALLSMIVTKILVQRYKDDI